MVSSEIAHTIEVNGIATNYHDEGKGPTVLLLHGSGPGVSAWANWRTTIPALAKRFRVLAPDLLGFGYTERPAHVSYDPATWLKHLTGFLDALGCSQVSVVGNSFGGGLALRLALEHAHRVKQLVLMGSVGPSFPITPGLEAVWGYQPSLDAMRRLLELFAYDDSLVSDDLARIRYEASIQPGVHQAYASMFPPPRQHALDAISLPEQDLRRIKHETLIIHGRDDHVIPLANSERLLRLIDRAQLHVFGRCGHWVQIEHADRFTHLLTDFLKEPSASQGL